ncbi:MAG: flagellar hook protein FlgE [Halomonas sp. 54_146]|nr:MULTISPECIES: flagellar hook protein FlgE [unclassified Halomonas]KUJ89111.1 MAG: flagellar hook protein FlgE [Halomonas sp. 54_146]HAA45455.1 flagellar hook protein FlgE [Halomonas sp.]
MSFSQALSGLNAQSENLKILGNNIANSQTVGFKSSGAIFSDVFAGANSQVGLGVNVADVRQDFTAGDLESTGRTLDLAIAGEGFYRIQEPNGQIGFSRNGQFSQNANGFLVTASGQQLTGYGIEEADPANPESETRIIANNPGPIQIPTGDIPAKQTAEVSAVYNLDASIDHTNNDLLQSVDVFNTIAREPGATEEISYHFANSYTVFDSLGNARNVSSYYTKVGDNDWDVRVAVDGYYDDENNFSLSFNANGLLTKDTNANGQEFIVGVDDGDANTKPDNPGGNGDDKAAITFPSENGADVLNFNFVLAGTTQFSGNSVQSALSQDGFASGALAGLSIDENGVIYRNYTNEQSIPAGQIVLANFANTEGLQPIGNNAWRQTATSGEPVIGIAGTGMFGTIESGVLENSNVDLAKQLVDTIVAQRAYQANSTSISTQDELLQTIINL